MSDQWLDRRWPWVLLFFCDVAKQGILSSLGSAQPWSDSALYWNMGTSVAQGDLWLWNHAIAFRTPGYPWYLGLCQFLAGSWGIGLALFGQHLAVLMTSLVTVWLVWRLTASRKLAVLAYLLCVLSTARPLYANWILTESLATALLLLAMAFMVQALHDPQRHWLIAAGLTLGLGLLMRPALVAAAIPLVITSALVAFDRRVGSHVAGVKDSSPPRAHLDPSMVHVWQERAILLLVGPCCVLLLIVPWCLRNQQMFQRFTLCAFTGRELWTASFSPWPGGGLPIPQSGEGTTIREWTGLAETQLWHQWTVSRALSRSGLNDVAVDDLMLQTARKAIRSHPQMAVQRTAVRCLTFWYCWEWPADDVPDVLQQADVPPPLPAPPRNAMANFAEQLLKFSPERTKIASLTFVVLSGLGLLRLLVSPPCRSVGILFATLLMTTTLLTAVLEIPLYRYRSTLEPVLIVALVAGWGQRVKKTSEPLALAGRAVDATNF